MVLALGGLTESGQLDCFCYPVTSFNVRDDHSRATQKIITTHTFYWSLNLTVLRDWLFQIKTEIFIIRNKRRETSQFSRSTPRLLAFLPHSRTREASLALSCPSPPTRETFMPLRTRPRTSKVSFPPSPCSSISSVSER